MTHTAQQLFEFSQRNATASRYVAASLACLTRHYREGAYKRDRARELLQRNARDVARLYAAGISESLVWPALFPRSVREDWCDMVLDAFEARACRGNQSEPSAGGTERAIQRYESVREAEFFDPRNESEGDHVAHVEGSEYVCTRCKRRWDLNDKEIPPCV